MTWRSLTLNVTIIRNPHLYIYYLKPQKLKQVEIIKVSDKTTYGTSSESTWLGDHWLWISPWSDILMWNYTIPNLQTWTCRVYKKIRWTNIWYISGKLLTWRSNFMKITMIRHPHVKLYHLKPQTLNHVEIKKVSEKPRYETSLESRWLGDHWLWMSPWSEILICIYTISNLKNLNR